MSDKLGSIVTSLEQLFAANKTGIDIKKRALVLLSQLEQSLLVEAVYSKNQTNVTEKKDETATKKPSQTLEAIENILFKAIISERVTPVDVILVRRAICRSLAALYANNLSLIPKCAGRVVKALESHSSQRNPAKFSQITCLLYVMSTLYGMASTLMPPYNSLTNTFAKLWKFYSDPIRVAIVILTTNVAKNIPRIEADWTEMLKLVQRAFSEPRTPGLRKSSGDLLYAIGTKLAPALSSNKLFEPTFAMCAKGMDDTDPAVRTAFGRAAGQILLNVITLEESKPQPTTGATSIFARKTATKNIGPSHALMMLTTSFTKVGSSKNLREGITISVLHYIHGIGKDMLRSNLELFVSNIIGLLGNRQSFSSQADILSAQTFVGEMIRALIYTLSETDKMTLLHELCQSVNKFANNEYALVCLFREIGVCCKVLGEIVIDKRDTVLDAILISLKHSSDYVRYVGALCMQSLANSIPQQSTSLVSALLGMVQMDHAELAMQENEKMGHKFANSLHGHSNALASLIRASARFPLSVSHMLCSAALDTASLLGLASASTAHSSYVSMRRQEACWVLLSSVLTLNDYWVKMNLEKIVELWDQCMGNNSSQTFPSDEQSITYLLRSRASVLLSLSVFLTKCESLLTAERLTQIFGYIANTVKLVTGLPQDFKPTNSGSLSAVNLLKMNLFDAIRHLPSSILSVPTHRQVINFITKMAFAEADGTISGTITSMLSRITRDEEVSNLLDEIQWQDYKFKLDDQSISQSVRFDAEGIVLVQELAVEADSSCILMEKWEDFFYERPLPPQVRLADSAIRLLGCLFVYHKSNSKNQIIDHLVGQIKIAYSKPEDVRGGEIIFANVITTTHTILRQVILNRQREGKKSGEDKTYYSNIHSIINASLGHPNEQVRRAAAECMACMATLLGEVLMDDLIKRCATKIVKEGPIKAGYALALGTVNKKLGSLSGLSYLPSIVSFLQALSRSPSTDTQLASFQSMWNTIDAAGIGFIPHVEAILQHVLMLFLSPVNTQPTEVPQTMANTALSYFVTQPQQPEVVLQNINEDDDQHLLLGTSRIIYALISMGPEMLKNERFIELVRFFMNDFLSSHLTIVKIEAVRLVQRIMMLAPELLPTNDEQELSPSSPTPEKRSLEAIILPHFVKFLSTPSLRQCTVSCLKIVVETKPALVNRFFTPDRLFQVLDEYEDRDLEEIISALIRAKVISVGIWIDLIKNTVYTESNVEAPVVKKQGGEDGEEEEEEKGMTDTTTVATTAQKAYNWQTKLFAIRCVKTVLYTYASEPNALDPKAARQSTQDLLVNHLSKMIDLCCMAIVKGTQKIKYNAVLALIDILRVFIDVPDPDIPSEPLLQQNTMKFSTAIAQGFEPKASPELTRAAALLASAFVPSRMVQTQPKTLVRILSLLTSFKLTDTIYDYGEIAATMVKMSVLQSLARTYTVGLDANNKELMSELDTHIPNFSGLWEKALVDYAQLLVLTDPTTAYVPIDTSKKLNLPMTFLELGTEQDCLKYYKKAYPYIIEAVTRGDYDQWVVLGIAVQGLYSFFNEDEIQKRHTEKTDIKQMSTALHIVHALTRLIPSKQFLQDPSSPAAVFEVLVLLVKIQTKREMELQSACLKLLNVILKEISPSFFMHSNVLVQTVVATAVEVCLKPLWLHFPLLFEQDSEMSLQFQPSKQQGHLVKQVMACLGTLLSHFGASCIHGHIIQTILYAIARCLQFTANTSAIDTAFMLSDLARVVPKDHIEAWNDSIASLVQHLSKRIDSDTISSPAEVELCIVVAAGYSGDTFEYPHDMIKSKIVTLLSHEDSLSYRENCKKASWLLVGLQNALLRLIRSNARHHEIAMFYATQLIGPIAAFVARICKEGKTSNIDFASNAVDIDLDEVPTNEEEHVVSIIQTSLNVVLATFALVDEKQKEKRLAYLALLIPMLILILRLESKFEYDENNIHTINVQKLHKLAVQCLERVASSAAQEFRQLIQHVLPPNVVAEIQQAAKKGANTPAKPKQEKVKQEVKRPSQKLTFDFMKK